MDVGSGFPLAFNVQTEFNETFEVRVEYGWRPKQCAHCNIFGHSTTACSKHPSPKPSTSNTKPTPTQLPPKAVTTINLPTEPPQPNTGHLPTPFTQIRPPTLPTNNPHNNPIPVTSPSPISPHPTTPNPPHKPFSPLALALLEEVEPLAIIPSLDAGPMLEPTAVSLSSGGMVASPPRAPHPSLEASAASDSSVSPSLWGHKVKMVDELDRKKKKNLKKSLLRKKKRALVSGSRDMGSHQPQ